MFEGTRLSYVVPGYTGHIPCNFRQRENVESEVREPTYQIPGYLGYIQSIKSENLFGKSYGRITQRVSNTEQVVGQDLTPQERYKTVGQSEFVDQKKVYQMTAAEIVGVKQNTYRCTVQDKQAIKTHWANHQVQVQNPLPGYTGSSRRVVADNIFGQTYANSLKTAQSNQQSLLQEKRYNHENQSQLALNFPK